MFEVMAFQLLVLNSQEASKFETWLTICICVAAVVPAMVEVDVLVMAEMLCTTGAVVNKGVHQLASDPTIAAT